MRNALIKRELNIAEEKRDQNQKQAIIETPKFSEYYSLIGKNST